jgi:ribosomal protein L35AE/L33A
MQEHLVLLIAPHGELFRVVKQSGVKVAPFTKVVPVKQFGVEMNIDCWGC